MKPKCDLRPLLEDVLFENAPADLPERLLHGTLRAARQRRYRRQLGRSLLLAGVVGALLWSWPKSEHVPVASPHGGPRLARATGPTLAPLPVFSSRPFPPEQTVHTQAGGAMVVESSATGVTLVVTAAWNHAVPRIDDRQLLALLGSEPVALVRRAAGEAELVLLDPAERPALQAP